MTKRETVRFLLRIPADLHKMLVESAADDSPPSSLNGEILSRLYDTFRAKDRYEAQLKELRDRITKLEKGE